MNAPRRRLALVLAISATVAAIAGAPSVALAGGCGTGATSLGNGGFEDPGVPAGTYAIYDAALVPPWSTTDVANGIEIWGDGFNGVPAFEGANFAELNANSAGTLYQDVVSTPGSTMTWTLQHRAREGTDVMRVLIGDATTADVFSDTGWDVISADISHDTTAWGVASEDYIVPAGQTCTRFAFRAVSTGSGNPSVGNFLDAVGFTVTIPAEPTPTPAGPTPTPAASTAATAAPQVTTPPTEAEVDRSIGREAGLVPAAVLAAWLLGAAALVARTKRRLPRKR